VIQKAGDGTDLVVLENYDDQDYGYLRVVVTDKQLRIEYHPASDGTWTKAPDDSVTVDLITRKLVHYDAKDLGHPQIASEIKTTRTGNRVVLGIKNKRPGNGR
jgi:hypothetical protein